MKAQFSLNGLSLKTVIIISEVLYVQVFMF